MFPFNIVVLRISLVCLFWSSCLTPFETHALFLVIENFDRVYQDLLRQVLTKSTALVDKMNISVLLNVTYLCGSSVVNEYCSNWSQKQLFYRYNCSITLWLTTAVYGDQCINNMQKYFNFVIYIRPSMTVICALMWKYTRGDTSICFYQFNILNFRTKFLVWAV